MSRASFKTKKGCHVRWIEIQSRGAHVGYDCGGGGRSFDFTTPDGGRSNYPSALIKGVRTVRVPGTTITGHGARIDFELIPRHVTCRKRGYDQELSCVLHTRDGSTLSGARRRRRRR